MEYSQPQLKYIQRQLVRLTENMKKTDGFSMLLTASEYITWVSHAKLAGYEIDKTTGRMYHEKSNVRTYFE